MSKKKNWYAMKNNSLEKERTTKPHFDLAISNLHTFSSCSARSHFDQID